MSFLTPLNEIGTGIIGRAVTKTLYVSPNGSGTNGLTWATAYTTIQDALDAASTDGDACTLIMISPHTSNYDINTAGDPTWSANVILCGTYRTWAMVKNTHASATSIMKLTGKAAVINLNFNLGAGTNGLVMAHGGFRVLNCQFIGEDLTSDATALEVAGSSTIKHGTVANCEFLGKDATHMTGVKLNNVTHSRFDDVILHKCKTAIQIMGGASESNLFTDIDIGDSGIGFDIDAGNGQHIKNVLFHGNTTNIDDEVGTHDYANIDGSLPIAVEPDNFTGVDVATGDGIDTWTAADVTVRAAAAKPFRITGISAEASANEKFRIRLTASDGSLYFADILVEGETNVNKRESITLPQGTEFIFNTGDVIKASAKSESDGVDHAYIWLEVQEI